MSGLDPSAKQPGKSEEEGVTSLDQNKERPTTTDTSERSQTPSTPRSFTLLYLHHCLCHSHTTLQHTRYSARCLETMWGSRIISTTVDSLLEFLWSFIFDIWHYSKASLFCMACRQSQWSLMSIRKWLKAVPWTTDHPATVSACLPQTHKCWNSQSSINTGMVGMTDQQHVGENSFSLCQFTA